MIKKAYVDTPSGLVTHDNVYNVKILAHGVALISSASRLIFYPEGLWLKIDVREEGER